MENSRTSTRLDITWADCMENISKTFVGRSHSEKLMLLNCFQSL